MSQVIMIEMQKQGQKQDHILSLLQVQAGQQEHSIQLLVEESLTNTIQVISMANEQSVQDESEMNLLHGAIRTPVIGEVNLGHVNI